MRITIAALNNYLNSLIKDGKGDFPIVLTEISIVKDQVTISDVDIVAVGMNETGGEFRLFDARTTQEQLDVYNTLDLTK